MLRYEKLFSKIIPKCFVKIIRMKSLISCNSNRLTRKKYGKLSANFQQTSLCVGQYDW